MARERPVARQTLRDRDRRVHRRGADADGRASDLKCAGARVGRALGELSDMLVQRVESLIEGSVQALVRPSRSPRFPTVTRCGSRGLCRPCRRRGKADRRGRAGARRCSAPARGGAGHGAPRTGYRRRPRDAHGPAGLEVFEPNAKPMTAVVSAQRGVAAAGSSTWVRCTGHASTSAGQARPRASVMWPWSHTVRECGRGATGAARRVQPGQAGARRRPARICRPRGGRRSRLSSRGGGSTAHEHHLSGAGRREGPAGVAADPDREPAGRAPWTLGAGGRRRLRRPGRASGLGRGGGGAASCRLMVAAPTNPSGADRPSSASKAGMGPRPSSRVAGNTRW